MRTLQIAATAALLALSVACSSAPETPAPSKAPPPVTAPRAVMNHTSLFPDEHKTGTSVVPDHILGMQALPGGSLADYEAKGKKYQMFIIDADSGQNAAFMMLDMKAQLGKDPTYLAHMGGYFGDYNGLPLYCFAKLHYLAGIVGLPLKDADPLGRVLAAQLH